MKKRTWPGRLLGLLTAAALALGFWSFENDTIAKEQWQVYSARLPAAFSGFRITVLADLHGKQFGRDNGRLLAAVRETQPDMIAIDGDLLDEHCQDRQWLQTFAEGLTAIAPTFFVTGNHEWRLSDREQVLQTLRRAGVTVLQNEYRVVRLGQAQIVVAGVDDPNGPYDMKTPAQLLEEVRKEHPDDFLLVLAHRNDQMQMWQELEPDLVLAGHGHGGIIRLPFIGGIVDHGRLGKSYSGGLYQLGKTQAAVSRGLGNSRGGFRLFNRPHLPVVVLQSRAQSLTNRKFSEIFLQER